MTTETATRAELIERIVNAARRPCPKIVELRRARHRVTGKVHSIFGMPFGFKAEDYETFVAGFVYTQAGTTYGICYPTQEAAEAAHLEREESTSIIFRNLLRDETDERLAEQAEFWLKHRYSGTY